MSTQVVGDDYRMRIAKSCTYESLLRIVGNKAKLYAYLITIRRPRFVQANSWRTCWLSPLDICRIIDTFYSHRIRERITNQPEELRLANASRESCC